jgi:hypothetical protein
MDENLLENSDNDRILDKLIGEKIKGDINASLLVDGDRDFILLWLRRTGYGNKLTFTISNEDDSKKYNVNLDLSEFPNNEFTLLGDVNGYFSYFIKENVLKFRYLTHNEIEMLKEGVFLKDYLKMITMSVDDKVDKSEINGFIDGLTEEERFLYYSFIFDNTPGVNCNFSVEIPTENGDVVKEVTLPINLQTLFKIKV